MSPTIYVQDFSGYLACPRQVENGVDNVFYLHDFSHWLKLLENVLGIILVQGCIHDAGGHSIEADAFFCVLDGETPGQRIQAPFRHHRNGGLFVDKRLIDKRSRYGYNVPRLLFQHLVHCELSDVQKTQKVCRDQGVEVLGGKVRKRLGTENPRVVHENVDGSEVLDRGPDSFFAGLLLTDVAINKNQAGGGRHRLTDLERGCDDVITFLQEALHETRPNTLLRSRDDCRFLARHTNSLMDP